MNPPDDLSASPTVRGYRREERVFRRYRLRRILGRGGMGVVWLAHDEQLERDVALKVLPEFLAYQPAALEDLRRETRRSLDLTHPHIVRVYDFVSDDSGGAISMEYIDGDTLSANLVRQPQGVFEVETLAPWVGQLCEALSYAHGRGKVIHRDLKPANLMVTSGGDLKVADFGIARSLRTSFSRMTQSSGITGTLVYMSPQQLVGEDPSPQDDVYSLGATLYELLTGRPPFTDGDLSYQIRERIPLSVNARRQQLGVGPVPSEWDRVVSMCLAKRVEERPVGPTGVWELLAAKGGDAPVAVESSVSSAPSHSGDSGRDIPPVAKARRVEAEPKAVESLPPRGSRRLLIAMGAIGVAGIVGVGAWYVAVFRPRNEVQVAVQQKAAEEAFVQHQREIEALSETHSAADLARVEKGLAEYLSIAPDGYRLVLKRMLEERAGRIQARLDREAAASRDEVIRQIDGLSESSRLVDLQTLVSDIEGRWIPSAPSNHLAEVRTLLATKERLIRDRVRRDIAAAESLVAGLSGESTDESVESAEKRAQVLLAEAAEADRTRLQNRMQGIREERLRLKGVREHRAALDAAKKLIAGISVESTPGDISKAEQELKGFSGRLTQTEMAELLGGIAAVGREREERVRAEAARLEAARRQRTLEVEGMVARLTDASSVEEFDAVEKRVREVDAADSTRLLARLAPVREAALYGRTRRELVATVDAVRDDLPSRKLDELATQFEGLSGRLKSDDAELLRQRSRWTSVMDRARAAESQRQTVAYEQALKVLAKIPKDAPLDVYAKAELELAGFLGSGREPEVNRVREQFLRRRQGAASLAKVLAAGGQPSKAKPFVNSLGLGFVPVPGTGVLFCVWETRVGDWNRYLRANGKEPVDGQEKRPISAVSWEEARAFCAWLTAEEQAAGRLAKDVLYRLPTDAEWSWAVGIGGQEDPDALPESKSEKIDGVFPWGVKWPVPGGAGNYEAGLLTDIYAERSPVGSFKPNVLGIFDLGGNVWEWCEDHFNQKRNTRVLRGGSWFDSERGLLLASHRFPRLPDRKDGFSGFRMVLAGVEQ